MACLETVLKDLKNENIITLVLNLRNERRKFIDKIGQGINNITFTVDNLRSKFIQVEPSLV